MPRATRSASGSSPWFRFKRSTNAPMDCDCAHKHARQGEHREQVAHALSHRPISGGASGEPPPIPGYPLPTCPCHHPPAAADQRSGFGSPVHSWRKPQPTFAAFSCPTRFQWWAVQGSLIARRFPTDARSSNPARSATPSHGGRQLTSAALTKPMMTRTSTAHTPQTLATPSPAWTRWLSPASQPSQPSPDGP